MGESIHYLSADLREIKGALSGRDPTLSAALAVLRSDVSNGLVRELLARMQQDQIIDWAAPTLRAAGWPAYRELSGFFAGVFRLLGRDLSFDAWEGGLRLQFLLADWSPLDRDRISRVCCRALHPIKDAAYSTNDLLSCEPWLQSWPHGYLENAELPEMIEGLHRVLGTLRATLSSDDGECPLDMVPPGSAISERALIELVTLDDGSLEGWQLARGAHLYNACCRAARRNRDLLCVGY